MFRLLSVPLLNSWAIEPITVPMHVGYGITYLQHL
jgi:hypothetical protein